MLIASLPNLPPTFEVDRPPITRENPFTATETRMRPEAGRFYVFPAWLEHGVEPNRGDSERVSIAFNVQIQRAGRAPTRS